VLAKIIACKYRFRSLNLKSNGVGDESAQQLLSAVKLNPFITKIKLDMNPAASSMISEIETVLLQNSHTVCGDSIPNYKHDIREVSNKTAESLLQCAFEQKVK